MAALTRVLASGGEASLATVGHHSLTHLLHDHLSIGKGKCPLHDHHLRPHRRMRLKKLARSGKVVALLSHSSINVCSAFSPSAVLIYSLSPLGRIDQSTSPVVSVTTGDKIASPTVAETCFPCVFISLDSNENESCTYFFLHFIPVLSCGFYRWLKLLQKRVHCPMQVVHIAQLYSFTLFTLGLSVGILIALYFCTEKRMLHSDCSWR